MDFKPQKLSEVDGRIWPSAPEGETKWLVEVTYTIREVMPPGLEDDCPPSSGEASMHIEAATSQEAAQEAFEKLSDRMR